MNNPKQNRGRHRNNARRSNPSRQNFDSNGPGVRIRGSATQVYEKYIQLARDAQTSGDPVTAETMLQHAEHYYRLLNEGQSRQQQNNNQAAEQPSSQNDDSTSDSEAGEGDNASATVETQGSDDAGNASSDTNDAGGNDGRSRNAGGNGRGRGRRSAGGSATPRGNGRGRRSAQSNDTDGDAGGEAAEGAIVTSTTPAAQQELAIADD